MRKIILINIVWVLVVLGVKAQLPKFTVNPGEIDALTENVSIRFDVTGTAVEGLSEVYIWSWSNDIGSPTEMLLCYEGGSASWGNISQNAKLTKVAGATNVFELKLPLTVKRNGVDVTFKTIADLFGVSSAPGKIKKFGFLLRNFDATKQTPGDNATAITLKALTFEEAEFRTFPSSISVNDVVSVYFNKNETLNSQMKVAKNITVEIALLTTDNIIISETSTVLSTTAGRTNEVVYSFMPSKLFGSLTSQQLSEATKCRVVFKGKLLNTDGTEKSVSSSNFTFNFSDYE